MMKLIRELRRREVFRTAGLYVGIAWILIEGASVLLDAFEAPGWVLRAMIIVAIIGLPVTVVLAWIFDITEKGIEVQAQATDTVVIPFGGRKGDFVVIGVLTVALAFSVYLNIAGNRQAVVEEIAPLSILVADFENGTGTELFDGLLEQALMIGIESAPHITAYQRNSARALAQRIGAHVNSLDTDVASLVAVSEGVNMVLAGSIEPAGSGFELTVSGIEPSAGGTLFTIKQKAGSTDTVLEAIGAISSGVREELGDVTLDGSVSPVAETFTASSLDAAKAYVDGLQLAYKGNHEDAVVAYRKAVELDPDFGRAFASLALSSSRLGLTDISEDSWTKALSLMDTMTERERLRTLGVYYASVTRNYRSAIDNFSSLVEKFPADAAGHNNLAVSYFYELEFENALEQGRKLVEIYPNSTLYRSNYALYAMYATELELAKAEAQRVVSEDPTFYKGYLPQAIAALDARDYEAAASAYEKMREAGARGESLAHVGLADMAMFRGRFDEAIELLRAGIGADEANENRRAVARKLSLLAEVKSQKGDLAGAAEDARHAMELDPGDAIAVASALVFQSAGEQEPATSIAEKLSGQLQPQRRAYGLMLEALMSLEAGNSVDAIDKLNAAIDLSDLWLIRLELGKAYLESGYAAEALAEFEAAESRRGEATSLFLDDVPTYRSLSELPYWIALAQLEIGMTAAARRNLEAFIELRPEGGILVADARDRL